jgi:hypothetical protein
MYYLIYEESTGRVTGWAKSETEANERGSYLPHSSEPPTNYGDYIIVGGTLSLQLDVVAALKETNTVNRIYLDDTDWYVVREFETGVEVPTEVLTKRAAARLAIA